MTEQLADNSHTAADSSCTGYFSFACISNTGLRRPHNEDNYLFFDQILPEEHQSIEHALLAMAPQIALSVVAVFDGMGGELAGEGASFSAASCLKNERSSLTLDEASLTSTFDKMQSAVRSFRAQEKLSSTGSTAVVLVCQGGQALLGNLGDSKAFLLHAGQLSTLSVSHTDEEILRELGIHRKPGLTQFLGVDDTDAAIEPHIVRIALEPGDRILLASDGLTDMVDELGIRDTMLAVPETGALVEKLCEQALQAGGIDNVTIICCDVPMR